MTTTQAALVPAVVTPDFDSFAVRQAIAGFLAGYGDATRDASQNDDALRPRQTVSRPTRLPDRGHLRRRR